MLLCQGCTLTGKVAGSASQEMWGGCSSSSSETLFLHLLRAAISNYVLPGTKVPQLPNIGLSVSAQHFLLTNICSLSRLSKYSKATHAFLQPQQSSWLVLCCQVRHFSGPTSRRRHSQVAKWIAPSLQTWGCSLSIKSQHR
uniref:Uncharacterized protein n=1 Tax=Micrurus spixii TaxID=129469 RepID=A0A2D4NDD5_9SAUR